MSGSVLIVNCRCALRCVVINSCIMLRVCRHTEPPVNELDRMALDVLRADRSLFAQELLLASLSGEDVQERAIESSASMSSVSATPLSASASFSSISRDTGSARAPIRAWEATASNHPAANGETRGTSRNIASVSEKNKTSSSSFSALSVGKSASSHGNQMSGSRDGL